MSVFARPLTGLLPDGYDIDDQAGYAPILPTRLGDVLLGLSDGPLHVSTHVAAGGDVAYAISGLADISDASVGDAGELRFRVQPKTGLTSHLVIVTDRSPRSVLVNGEEFGRGKGRWVEDTGLLFVTIPHEDASTIEVLVR